MLRVEQENDRRTDLDRVLGAVECRSTQDERRKTWLLETDLGRFVDPFYGVELGDAKMLTLHWQQNRTEGATAKTAKRTSKQ